MPEHEDDKMSMSTVGLSQDFLVNAEIKGRRVNEAIERGMRGSATAVFLCECGHLSCSRTMEVPLEDYGRIRQSFDHFIVAPGHEIASVDRLIQRHEDYVVVAKRHGRPADLARATDPRAGDTA
jgi:hypothetical protein